MSYLLGIDLGTTRLAAAVGRLGARPVDAEVVNLGDRASAVPSVVFLGDDGSIVVGEAAERRAVTHPDHVVREFKRRIGDPTPIMVGGRPRAAEELSAMLVRWVVDRVAQQEAGPAARIAVTHPASWGTHKKDRLGGALTAQGLPVTFLAEPQAAALHYAAAERVEPGSTIAVYDLGGGTFDAAVVHKDRHGFSLLGRPEGIDRLGGVDFDEVVFEHVMEALPQAFEGLDESDPAVLSAVAAVRRECVEAKEALSSDTEVTIRVITPAGQGSVRLHRSEFEAAIRPQVEDTVDALRRAVASAGLAPSQLSAVLLVGGSSRIPLVGELVSEQLGRPVTVDVDPKNAIAMGAVLSMAPAPPGTGAWAPQVPHPRSATGSARYPIAAAAAAGSAGAQTGRPTGQPVGGGYPTGPYGGPSTTGGYGHHESGTGTTTAPTDWVSGGPSGPRPTPPPRPSYAPAPLLDRPDDREFDYAAPRGGRSPAWLVSAGGIAAGVAVVATLFLWPSAEPVRASNVAPSPSTPAQQAPTATPAPTTSAAPPTSESPRTTRPAPTQPPSATRTTAPQETSEPPAPTTTTTRNEQPSSSPEPPPSSSASQPPTSANPPPTGGASGTPDASADTL